MRYLRLEEIEKLAKLLKEGKFFERVTIKDNGEDVAILISIEDYKSLMAQLLLGKTAMTNPKEYERRMELHRRFQAGEREWPELEEIDWDNPDPSSLPDI